jgi:galactose oxidase
MANLGNAWHIPGDPEPHGHAGMRDPVGAIVPGTAVTILSGNQFQGAGNAGNQLQTGSSIFFRRRADPGWTPRPLIFDTAADNNKYYAATIPADTFKPGDVVQYYLRIAYDDHATTFLQAAGAASAVTADEAAARSAPFTFTVESSDVRGEWGPVFALPNVGIHAHLLPNGLVLMWGRRGAPGESLDVHESQPFLLNPATRQARNTRQQPAMADGTKVNLFCSGHTFLADGRLLVVGGHFLDSQGLNQAVVYDPAHDTWTPSALMNHGRWYPSAVTLPDGSALVVSGSFLQNGQTPNNVVPQLWSNGAWTTTAAFPDARTFDLFPRLHVTSDGLVFMSGPQVQSWTLTLPGGGRWTQVAPRDNALRDYAPSVLYDVDKVIYIGGGNDQGTRQPTAAAEIIDLSATPPRWKPTSPMNFPRRQHNATLLPDGTVLVTGGTRGGGGPGAPPGFNDLGPGEPVHSAELWDPATGRWTELAAEQVDRCYHATAVLLPDATVLSAGGGEYRPVNGVDMPNDPVDSHRDAQIFSPPYLFKGARPDISAAPDSVDYGATFQVGTLQPNDIGRVSLVRLSSVTHSFNMNQRINVLAFQVAGGVLKVTAPKSPNVCPPGHYMLFILNRQGVPSVARMVQVRLPAAAAAAPAVEALTAAEAVAAPPALDALGWRSAVRQAAKGTAVLVGITGTCPYGIGACWGGANEALRSLEGVHNVDPIPDVDDSTATLFLQDDRLPPLDRWGPQFEKMVNGSYVLRGVEVTLQGTIEERGGQLFLADGRTTPLVRLALADPADKVQWDRATGAPKPLEPAESEAYGMLAADARTFPPGQRLTVTGPLKQTADGYQLEVRLFKV